MDATFLTPPPAKLWLASQEWRVVPVLYGAKELDDAYGITVFEPENIIYYASDRPAREVFDTVWHEVTHAINHAFDITMKSKSARKNDETCATGHGHAWTQVLLNNPALLEWIHLAVAYIKSEQENIEG